MINNICRDCVHKNFIRSLNTYYCKKYETALKSENKFIVYKDTVDCYNGGIRNKYEYALNKN